MNPWFLKKRAEQARLERLAAEKEFAKKLEFLRSGDLMKVAMAEEQMKTLMGELSDEEAEQVMKETTPVAEGYSSMLSDVADLLEDPKTRKKIIEALKSRV